MLVWFEWFACSSPLQGYRSSLSDSHAWVYCRVVVHLHDADLVQVAHALESIIGLLIHLLSANLVHAACTPKFVAGLLVHLLEINLVWATRHSSSLRGYQSGRRKSYAQVYYEAVGLARVSHAPKSILGLSIYLIIISLVPTTHIPESIVRLSIHLLDVDLVTSLKGVINPSAQCQFNLSSSCT